MANDGARLLNLFLGEAGRGTHLESREKNWLWLEIVFQGLQSCDQDTIGKTLQTVRKDRIEIRNKGLKAYLINDILKQELLVSQC